MDAERRVVLRDLLVAGWLVVLSAEAVGVPPAPLGAVLAGALSVAAFAAVAEHTAAFEGLLEDLGPHRVAGLLFVGGLAATIAVIWSASAADPNGGHAAPGGFHGFVFGAGLGGLCYRVAFGVVGPVPKRLLDRERNAAES